MYIWSDSTTTLTPLPISSVKTISYLRVNNTDKPDNRPNKFLKNGIITYTKNYNDRVTIINNVSIHTFWASLASVIRICGCTLALCFSYLLVMSPIHLCCGVFSPKLLAAKAPIKLRQPITSSGDLTQTHTQQTTQLDLAQLTPSC